MRVSNDVLDRNSDEELGDDIHSLSDAGAAVIHVRTSEVSRCLDALRTAITVDEARYREWDVVNGWREFDIQNRQSPNVTGDKKVNFAQEIRTPEETRKSVTTNPDHSTPPESARGSSMQYFVFVNPQYWVENNPVFAHMVLHYAKELPSTDIRVIIVTPDVPLPEAVSDSLVTVRFNPPGHAELREYLDEILGELSEEINLSDEEKDRICFSGAGMSQEAFEMYASIAIVEASKEQGEEESLSVTADDILAGVNTGKTAIVNRNDLLELYPGEDMKDVGGLDLLKEWINKRKDCFTEEAVEFGIRPPKGIVFVGPPGTGKSLAAKAVAKELGVPLIRLDFGKVFNRLVGSSEERIRTALRQVSYMAPCVLFVDEIDKGLGGIGGGGGDSGTSSRVLGTFLTWLNDNQAPVFTMVTANNITGLPPELMRRGRFDDIFASGLPSYDDRRDILEIHLRKRGWSLKKLDGNDLEEFLHHTNGFSGAEIEAAVAEGLIDGYSDGATKKTFDASYILRAAQGLNPLSSAYKVEILAMTTWAEGHARAASTKKNEPSKKVTNIAAKQRIRQRSRKPKGTVH